MAACFLVALFATTILGCDNCYGPNADAIHVRNVRRMQPDAVGAVVKPRGPLEWGQLNFLQTTDTHGWLEGHIKEQNYGADWGDYVSFVQHMKNKASTLGVDLLLIDTGDLHDGAGLSDAITPNGILTNPIFENIDYDLLTIGNHELYVTDIAYEHFNGFSKVYGERYLTSNVKILNPTTGGYDYIGHRYRYFTTAHGLRIMSFGVIFDFNKNTNYTKITYVADLIKESWFLNAVNYKEPIDLFVVIGHNPIKGPISTMGTLFKTIRALRPNTPIQIFGGHTHIRDFAVYDGLSTGIESGRYCETLGWLSISGINSSTFNGTSNPKGVPHPTQKAVNVSSANALSVTSNLVYSRRYLDWNRLTFAYHAATSQDKTFDYRDGSRVSAQITGNRKDLHLTDLYGCAPKTYCQLCKPYGADGNILGLLETALRVTVVNESRADIPRLIFVNSGGTRFDLVEGPFTYDDSFIVVPFVDVFQYIPEVPYKYASQVLNIFNQGSIQKRGDLSYRDFGFTPLTGEVCPEGITQHGFDGLKPRSTPLTRGFNRRQTSKLTPGYTTQDDFGTDGDDTPHSIVPSYTQPNDIQANASFPTNGSLPDFVDVIFPHFVGSFMIPALNSVGGKYKATDIHLYLPENFTTNSYLPAYAKLAWQENVPNCPVGTGVGSDG